MENRVNLKKSDRRDRLPVSVSELFSKKVRKGLATLT